MGAPTVVASRPVRGRASDRGARATEAVPTAERARGLPPHSGAFRQKALVVSLESARHCQRRDSPASSYDDDDDDDDDDDRDDDDDDRDNDDRDDDDDDGDDDDYDDYYYYDNDDDDDDDHDDDHDDNDDDDDDDDEYDGGYHAIFKHTVVYTPDILSCSECGRRVQAA